MNMLYYLVPVVGIAGMLFYTRWAQANVRKRAAAGEGPQMFHDSFADKFEVLAPDERLIGMWMGLAYITPDTTVGQVAATVAKEMALAAINRSTYTPTVYVGLTTHGRVLVSEEYTEMGRRNNFKVVCALPAGARVVSGQAAKPDHQGAPPRNTYSADAPSGRAVPGLAERRREHDRRVHVPLHHERLAHHARSRRQRLAASEQTRRRGLTTRQVGRSSIGACRATPRRRNCGTASSSSHGLASRCAGRSSSRTSGAAAPSR
jgi:hypothetical protein